jgi:hypothetical protein
LSHTSNPLLSGYFGNGVSQTICPAGLGLQSFLF